MKKYKIRVRVLPENICCNIIINALNFWNAYERLEGQLRELDFISFETLSIGEL